MSWRLLTAVNVRTAMLQLDHCLSIQNRWTGRETSLASLARFVMVRRVATLPLLVLFLSAPPVVKAPALRPGDEHVYTGDAVEESLRQDQPYTRRFKLLVRAYVLRTDDHGGDVAVMTSITPVEDAVIAKTAVDVAGAAKAPIAGSRVQLELVRVQHTGETLYLVPPAAAPPLILTAATKTAAVPAPLCDGVTPAEHAIFPHRPLTDPKPAVVLDGTEVVEFDQTVRGGNWSVRQRHWLSPADGLTRVLWRQAEHIGRGVRIHTRLDLQPVLAYRGPHAEDLRREIEFAWWFGMQVGKQNADALTARIDRHTADHPATDFRPAIEAPGQVTFRPPRRLA
jgi:hypothetical protein